MQLQCCLSDCCGWGCLCCVAGRTGPDRHAGRSRLGRSRCFERQRRHYRTPTVLLSLCSYLSCWTLLSCFVDAEVAANLGGQQQHQRQRQPSRPSVAECASARGDNKHGQRGEVWPAWSSPGSMRDCLASMCMPRLACLSGMPQVFAGAERRSARERGFSDDVWMQCFHRSPSFLLSMHEGCCCLWMRSCPQWRVECPPQRAAAGRLPIPRRSSTKMAEKLPLPQASSIGASVDRRVLYGGWEQPWTTAVHGFRSVDDRIRGGASSS